MFMNNEVSATDSDNSLELLAKLLAAEDISVEHSSLRHTASFDLATRTLNLPVWKKMSKRLYHMLVLHEVGHALYTPLEEWKTFTKKYGSKFAGFLNVVEDARIERKMKIKFPGSRIDFFEGYKELHGKDFFSVKNKSLRIINLIDRLNLHFKIGALVGISFSEAEAVYVSKMENAVTFSDVVALATELFQRALDIENAKDANETDDIGYLASEPNETETDDSEPNENEIETDDSETDDSETDDGRSLSDDDDGETGDDDDGETGDDDRPSELDTSTDESLNHHLRQDMIDISSKRKKYIDFGQSFDYHNYVTNFRDVLASISAERQSYLRGCSQSGAGDRTQLLLENSMLRYTQFLKNNTKVVNYLAMKFEIMKAADQYSRTRSAKTGSINPIKLHAYKLSEDIFRRVTITTAAKSHGLVMFLDFSGSMTENMTGTIEQLLNLVMFCRKVNIPHRVYAFQSNRNVNSERPLISPPFGELVPSVSLLELFHEKMRFIEYKQMSMDLLDFGCSLYRNSKKANFPSPPLFASRTTFMLGDTPLNASIMLSRKIIKDFRAEKNIQIVNSIFMTDGASCDMYSHRPGVPGGDYVHQDSVTVMRDKTTGYEVCHDYRRGAQTKFLITCVGKSEKVRNICFRIATSREIKTQILRHGSGECHKDKKYVSFPGLLGFDQYFMINGKDLDLNVEESYTNGASAGDSKSKLARAFSKSNSKRSLNRHLLSNFIENIAA